MRKKKFKAVCFDWGNTIEIGKPTVVDTVQLLWKQVIPKFKKSEILAAAQTAWRQLAKMTPSRSDLQDMSEFREMLYARQAELMAGALQVEPDIPDWPWVANVFFHEHYFSNRTWTIPRSHARLLRRLRSANVPMAIIANTEDPAELPRLVADLGLTGFFQLEISSASYGFSKPHPKIYLAALESLDLRADQVIYVGDDYHNDYWGPEQVGMYSVLFDPQGLHARVESIRRIKRLDEVTNFFSLV